MSDTVLEKIKAYGLNKRAIRVILGLLDSVQGYSRKYDVLQQLAVRETISERKFINSLIQLENIKFIEIIKENDKPTRVKLDKRIWNREPTTIQFEAQLIKDCLNTNTNRWINTQTKIRYIRQITEQHSGSKPLYHAVEIHFLMSLNKHKYKTNKAGRIKLIDNGISVPEPTPTPDRKPEEEAPDEEGIDQNIFSTPKKDSDDIFSPESDREPEDETPDEEGIDQNIFGTPQEGKNNESLSETKQNDIPPLKSNINSNTYLNSILDKLSSKQGLKISESYNELKIHYDSIIITVSYNPSHKELLLESQHELETTEIIEALKIFCKSDMLGQLAIDTKRNIDWLLLRKRINIHKYEIDEIILIIDRVIYEAIQLQKLKE